MPDLSFRASLKNPEVEEPVDLFVHRPLGYLVARAAYPLPVSADAVTIASMLVGIASGVLYAWPLFGGARHLVAAGSLFILSAVLDCSDGQLARMRARSTRYGRMLDGLVDAVVQVAVVPVAAVEMLTRIAREDRIGAIVWTVLSVLAILSGIRHTTLYDQFKNVFVRNTEPHPKDCDDLDAIEAEWAALRASRPVRWTEHVRYGMYRLHLQLVATTMRVLDPNMPERFADMPAYSPERAKRFRAGHLGLMRAWSFFGIGTHIFLFALASMFDRLEAYIILRLVGFNALLLFLVPAQRRASRAFFHDAGEDDSTATPMAA